MKVKVVAVLMTTLLAVTSGVFAQGGGRAGGGGAGTGTGVPVKDGTGVGAPTGAGTKTGVPAKAVTKTTAPKGQPAQAIHEPGTGLPK